MGEETVICSNCNREVPKTLYCIYCNAPLFKEEDTQPKTITEETSMTKPEGDEGNGQEVVKNPSSVKPAEEEEHKVELDPETQSIMEELEKYLPWKIKLLSRLCDGDVSEEVFTKIFDGYQSKIDQLIQLRDQKTEQFREKLYKNKEEMKEAELKLEELQIRCAIGEFDGAELESKAPELEKKIRDLKAETPHLEAQLTRLDSLLQGKSLKEIQELENNAKHGYRSLKTLVDAGKISRKTAEILSNDTWAVLKSFDSTIGDKKREEEKLGKILI
jgi:chromosome segregation ATPase